MIWPISWFINFLIRSLVSLFNWKLQKNSRISKLHVRITKRSFSRQPDIFPGERFTRIHFLSPRIYSLYSNQGGRGKGLNKFQRSLVSSGFIHQGQRSYGLARQTRIPWILSKSFSTVLRTPAFEARAWSILKARHP